MKTIYLCGPTLYSPIHIGNARSLVFFDVLSEYYRRFGGVVYSRNITDVDDKILAQCSEGQTPADWVDTNTLSDFRADCLALGLKAPDHEPRASEYFTQVHSISKEIGDTQPDSSITLDTSKVPEYGEVSNRKTNSEFALWKGGERGTYTEGVAGWHGECQAMIHSIYGAGGVDIHGGGSDLKFPHHENENAIHRCMTGNPIARSWVHVGTVEMDGQKMSKSLGNVLTVADLSKDFSPQAIRTALLMTAYSRPIRMDHQRLLEAEKMVAKNLQHAWLNTEEWSTDITSNFTTGYKTRL